MIDPTWPSGKVLAVTPSNTTDFAQEVRQVYVATSGDVSVVNTDNTVVTFLAVPAGTHLGPFFIKRINATATTASNMIAYT